MASLLAETFTPPYLARLASCILKTPYSMLDVIFDPNCTWPITSVPVSSLACTPTVLTDTMCQRLLPVINHSHYEFSPDTVPFALCILLRYRMTPADDVLKTCDPAHVIMAAILLAHGWLCDWPANVKSFADMANVTPECMRLLKLRLYQALDYRVWIPEDEFHRHSAKLLELWTYAYSGQIVQQGFSFGHPNIGPGFQSQQYRPQQFEPQSFGPQSCGTQSLGAPIINQGFQPQLYGPQYFGGLVWFR